MWLVIKLLIKVTSISKKPAKELHNDNDETEEDAEITTHKKRYISPEERQQIINELRLNYNYNYINELQMNEIAPKKDASF